ncbi:uncharacterized protein METZ01_LOCUS329803, partial [marine metagenome]
EVVVLLNGGGFAHGRRIGVVSENMKVFGHEDNQNALHAVEAEPFCSFVAYNIWNALRQFG